MNHLQLVYPPFTNQEGHWLWNDPEVREYVKDSKLYMIAHRPELKFVNYEFVPKLNGFVKFHLQMGDIHSPVISLSISDELKNLAIDDLEIELEMGDKLIRIRDANNHSRVLMWITPDKFLFEYWRGELPVFVQGNFDHREFTRFGLYYVGISKKHDSFSRLFEKAHHARLNILTNEHPKTFGARLTDELLILLFDIDPTNINIIHSEDDIDSDLFYRTEDTEAIFADAEKAFVSLLETKYNEVQFMSYPSGADGLYPEGLTKYTYTISEDITFYTEKAVFNGSYNTATCDFIFIEGDTANLVKCT